MCPKIGDILILIAVLLIGGAAFFASFGASSQDISAVIYVDGVKKHKVSLSGLEMPISITVSENGFENTVIFENRRARVESATCPDKTCVHSGWLTKPGQSAVCLKTRMILRIESESGDLLDAVSG